MIISVEVDQPMRLDVYLSAALSQTRSQVKNLVDRGDITVDNSDVKCGFILKGGESIEVNAAQVDTGDVLPENIPLNIIYEDDSFAVVDKSQGMVVHPAAGNRTGTLVNALMYRYSALSSVGGAARAGIVHRLDKDTSGLLVVARTETAHAALAEQIALKTAHRRYIALLEGVVKVDEQEIGTFLDRDVVDRKKFAVNKNGKGKFATTYMRVLRRYDGYTLAEFVLGTGRTHQIRVHAASVLRHPVVGDLTYGYAHQHFKLNGQLLHAYRLSFDHPRTHEFMDFIAPLPLHFKEVLAKLTLTEETPFAKEIPVIGE